MVTMYSANTVPSKLLDPQTERLKHTVLEMYHCIHAYLTLWFA